MANIDMIELALSAPIDWGKFESIVYDLLVEDGYPQLRKLGGRGDHGLDSFEEAFYSHKSSLLEVAVQITSQKTQKVKVADTLAKLRKYEIEPRTLIMVFRDECAAGTMRSIKAQGEAAGLFIDIRDRSYLVQQLGRNTTAFARHLGGDVRTQVERLLEKADPLQLAHDELKRSVLATVAAFSLNRHTKLVKGKLFDRAVLAVIAASKKEIDKDELLSQLEPLFPGEQIDHEQIGAALDGLKSSGEIKQVKGKYKASDEALASVGRILLAVESAHAELLSWVVESISSEENLSDAARGYIEKNVRDAITLLVRLIGPVDNGNGARLDKNSEVELGRVLSRNVSADIGRKLLVAIAGYVENQERRSQLAPFIRAYTALAIRNLDPIGRRWQSSVISRSTVVLDTDAVLKLLVVELPEHDAIKKAVNGLIKEGVKVIVPDHVLRETLSHIERAYRTYNKFKDSLARLPLSVVHAKVWHAVVRGYAYALVGNKELLWGDYYSRYFDRDEPLDYLVRMLNKRALLTIEDLHDIPESDVNDFASIAVTLEQREQSRLKAEFRGGDDMHDRVESDLRMLFNLAERQSSSIYKAKGYLVTEDSALFVAERLDEWGNRPKIAIMTRTLPELSSFVCGADLDDSDVVRLVFEPLIAATAELMADDIDVLARSGADLSGETLDQLEWKLEKGLRNSVHEFQLVESNGGESDIENASLKLIEDLDRAGVSLEPGIAEAARNYRSLKEASEKDKAELLRLKAAMKDALFEAAGESAKGRARANRALDTLNVKLGDKGKPDS